MISKGSYRQIENPRKACAHQGLNLKPTDEKAYRKYDLLYHISGLQD
jgi:hypothetical protein